MRLIVDKYRGIGNKRFVWAKNFRRSVETEDPHSIKKTSYANSPENMTQQYLKVINPYNFSIRN